MKKGEAGFFTFLALCFFSFSVRAGIPTGDLLEGVKPGKDGKIDVLTVFPHPDDEMYCLGTLLKLKTDPRVRIHLLVMTLGELSPAKDTLQISSEKMAEIRGKEIEKVATVLQADSLIRWNYNDQGLPQVAPNELGGKILEVMNQTEAEIIIGYGPEGITGHPDHIAGYQATEIAFKKSRAQKLYYVNVPKALYPIYRVYALSPNKPDPLPATVKVDVRPFKKMKMLAITEHASQKYFIGRMEQLEMSLNFNYEYFTLALARTAEFSAKFKIN